MELQGAKENPLGMLGGFMLSYRGRGSWHAETKGPRQGYELEALVAVSYRQ